MEQNRASAILYVDESDRVSLPAVLAASYPLWHVEAGGPVALLYTPRACIIARMTHGAILETAAGPLSARDLDRVFEARVFGPGAELRWLLDPVAGSGRAVVLRETAVAAGAPFRPAPQVEVVESHPVHYLLWGSVSNANETPGFVTLAEARLGRLVVPAPSGGMGRHRHMGLTAIEYIGPIDDDGNVAVIEERLCNLEAMA